MNGRFLKEAEMRKRNRVKSSQIALFILLVFAGCVEAVTIRRDRDESDYFDLADQYQYECVCQLNCGGSGILIAPTYVLTAAHILQGVDAVSIVVSFKDSPIRSTAASYEVNPDFLTVVLGSDIAVIRLQEPILDVTPAELYSGTDEVGKLAIIVGYGIGGDGISGAVGGTNEKRAGHNVIDAIDATKLYRCLVADFDNPDNPLDSSLGSSIPRNLVLQRHFSSRFLGC